MPVAELSLVAAVVVSAMAASASLDQSIKQLPTRRHIGVVAYSAYSQVADGRNGMVWYVPLAVAWVVANVAAAVLNWGKTPALVVVLSGLVSHAVVTGLFAAPTLLSQRHAARDEKALRGIFDRFARWQALRAAIDVMTLCASVWALVATLPG